ncbi:MAG TPA: SMC family ATPase [Acidimicrobiia bacterium]|nr:SMC family ATPase [Acidimicrobiia bacterium]
MRPVSIEVEGFSAYRSRVEVDFAGVDFFSITGPTGSGKSSLVDAMIFALFGRVPRLGGNSVAPAITAGADRARVRFDFEVDGDVYTAVRLAQRTSSGGATVKEARLQKGDLPVASGADEVTGAVEDLLKLTFDDFTRTVVLPQGDFARFLTATKAERQGLLRNLLGMDVYTTVRELAKTRAAVASDRAEGANHALEGLEMASAEEIEAMVARRDGLNALAEAMPGHEEELADLDKTVTETQRVVDSVSDRIERLSAIEEPPRLADLDQLVETARSALVDAAAAVESASLAVEETTAALAAMPGQDTIEMWVKSRERLAEMGTRLAESKVDEARSLAQEAQTRLDDAAGALSAARGRLEEARTRHAAHLLAATLVVGEECPVCAREVAAIPISETPGGLDELESEVERLGAVVESARADAESARENFTRIETGAQALDEQVAALRAELETAPEPAELARIETDRKGLVEELERRRQELVALQEEEKRARSVLEDLADDSRRVSKLLREAERSVADLDPPLPETDDVVVQWKELMTWRSETLERLQDDLEQARLVAAAAVETSTTARRRLEEMLGSHGIEARPPYMVQVATALQEARSRVEAHEKTKAEAARLEEQIRESTEQAGIAQTLANHLRANGFEQWLMSGALTELVAGANELLGQLSGDSYSLDSDDSGTFTIVDHRNADEVRSVSTLSGGETFLVSLALALSLAETLAAKGGSGLDAIILDEGFGTLDEESLDTVASVLEELSVKGLMVGVITHVKELAARSPVRYEVRREPTGAAVRLMS